MEPGEEEGKKPGSDGGRKGVIKSQVTFSEPTLDLSAILLIAINNTIFTYPSAEILRAQLVIGQN